MSGKIEIVAGTFPRSPEGPVWKCSTPNEYPLSGQAGWQSNGGPFRGHPDRAKPFRFDVRLPALEGTLQRIGLVGIFALHATADLETAGTLGAAISLESRGTPIFRIDLRKGRHYDDATDAQAIHVANGDGTSRDTLGNWKSEHGDCRVDVLWIDVGPIEEMPETLILRDLGSPASFVIFDVLLAYRPERTCPFSGRGGGVPLAEVGSIIRLGDRVRWHRALDQLERSVFAAEDMDEARGQVLTFLAVATAATLELGAPRSMHRVQLDSARALDQLHVLEAIAKEGRTRAEMVVQNFDERDDSPSAYLVDRALAIIGRNFAKPLQDYQIATELGLSTSHFRYLFRKATGLPFHKFLIAARLEQAKKLLLEQELSVTEVAGSVGFTSLAHFSRAFASRFNISPSELRRAGSKNE